MTEELAVIREDSRRTVLLMLALVGLLFACSCRCCAALAKLYITPDIVRLQAGLQMRLTLFGLNADGETVSVGQATWSATAGAGTVTQSGLFTAGTTVGAFPQAVTARYSGLTATANIEVVPADSNGGYILERSWKTSDAANSLGGSLVNGEMVVPLSVAVDRSGNVFVTDPEGQRVQKFDRTGRFLAAWDTYLGCFFAYPYGVAVDASGYVYVTDDFAIQKFSAQGTLITQWYNWTLVHDTDFGFWGVAPHPSGGVVVSDHHNHRLVRVDASGTTLATWGDYGGTGGLYRNPAGLACDGSYIYVADVRNYRVQKLNLNGDYVLHWGTSGTGPGQFTYVEGVAFSGGYVYTVESYSGRVQKFTTNGAYVTEFGGAGTGPGQLFRPEGIAVDQYGAVYVANTNSGSICKFVPLPPETVPPDTQITSGPANGSLLSTSSVTFTFTGSDDVTATSSLLYATQLDSGAWSAYGSATSALYTGLSSGQHTFSVRARDAAGNVDPTPATRTFTTDTTPPTTPSVTDDGAWQTSRTQIHATFSSSDGESGIAEYRYAIGTSASDPGSGYLAGWTSTGTAGSVTRTGLSLKDGQSYYVYVKSLNNAGLWSSVGVSDGIMVDTSPPATPVVVDDGGYQASTTSLHASWSSTDPQSGVTGYQYAIGASASDPGSGYIVGWTSASSSVTRTGLSLTSGQTYYFYVKAQNGAGMWSAAGTSDGITVDASPPTTPAVADDGLFQTSLTSLHASWTSTDPQSGIAEYQYAIGTSPTVPASGFLVPWTSTGTTPSVTASPVTLAPGQAYYFYVKARNGAGQWSQASVSDGIIPDVTPPATPSISIQQEQNVTGSDIKARWTTRDSESGIAESLYALGTSAADPGSGYIVPWTSAGSGLAATLHAVDLAPGSICYVYVRCRNGAGAWSETGVSEEIRLLEPLKAAPKTGTLTPSSGQVVTGTPHTFEATFDDPNGFADIADCRILLNTVLSGANGIFLRFDLLENKIYLRSDNNAVWLGGFAPGSANTIENSRCTIFCAGTTVSGQNQRLTIACSLLLKPAAAGKTLKEWLYAGDRSGLGDGWNLAGEIRAVSLPPVNVSLEPNSGRLPASRPLTFTTVQSDPNGFRDIKASYLLINSTLTGVGGVYARYDAAANKLYLRNDANTAWSGGHAPGSSGTVENSRAILYCSETAVSGSGDALTIGWRLEMKPTMAGRSCLAWLYASDAANLYTGFEKRGEVSFGGAPANVSLDPNSGKLPASQLVTFTTVQTDPNGFDDIKASYILINSTLSGVGAAYAWYDAVANKLYLRNDANTAWSGGCAPGATDTIENSRVKLHCSETAVSGSGDTLTIGWRLEMKPPMVGQNQAIWLYAADIANQNTGFEKKGEVSFGGPPANVSLEPSAGDSLLGGAKTALTATYADPDGSSDIRGAYLVLNTALSSFRGISLWYDEDGDKLYLRDDMDTAWLGGAAPGSDVVIQNSYCKLYCAETTIGRNGGNLSVRWMLEPKAPVMGRTLKSWMYVLDSASLADGWDQIYTIGVPDLNVSVVPINTSVPAGQEVMITATCLAPRGKAATSSYLLLNASGTGSDPIYFGYDGPANKMYLRNDANSAWLGGYEPGSANTISNRFVAINCANSSAAMADNQLEIRWSLTPLADAAGRSFGVRMYTMDTGGLADGWDLMGTLTFAGP